jgi:hypothetical protein
MSVPIFLVELDVVTSENKSAPQRSQKSPDNSKPKRVPKKKQLELRRVPGYVNNTQPQLNPIELNDILPQVFPPSASSSLAEYNPSTVEVCEHPAPVPTTNEEIDIDMVRRRKSGSKIHNM